MKGVPSPPEGMKGVPSPPEGMKGVPSPPEGMKGVPSPPEWEVTKERRASGSARCHRYTP